MPRPTASARLAPLILAVAGCSSHPTAANPAGPAESPAAPATIDATPPAAAAPAAPAVPTGTRSFPFEFSGGKVFVDVMVNGKGPYPFALDTGSPPTCIDIKLAKDLGLAVTEIGRVGGAGEGTAAYGSAQDVALTFGGVSLPPRTMMAADLNERLAPFGARPVMGLIGNDFVSSRIVELDYPNERITIYPKDWEYTGAGTILPSRTRGYTFVNGRITLGQDSPGAGQTLDTRFLVDTGASLAASLTTPFVNKEHLLQRAGPRFKASVGWGLGGEVRHDVCRLDAIELGDLRIDRPVCTLSQDGGGALAARAFDGLVGGDLLGRYKVILDGPHRRMILEPGPRAAKPYEFDMSGLSLTGDAGRGALMVHRVRDHSPAAEAGILEGDTILAIDGTPVSGRDRERVRELLRVDGATRTLRLKRSHDELDVRLTLRRMVLAPAYGGEHPHA